MKLLIDSSEFQSSCNFNIRFMNEIQCFRKNLTLLLLV